jgi:hypothetical protein
VPGSRCSSTGCRPSKRRPQQAIDVVPHLLAWKTVAELELDKADEQRIDRAPGGQELLRDLGERVGAGDHPGKGADLAACALGVTDGSGPLVNGGQGGHGRTKTAPVMPAAA